MEKLNKLDQQNLLELKLAVDNFNEKLETMENQLANRRVLNDKRLSFELEDVNNLYANGLLYSNDIKINNQREVESDDEIIHKTNTKSGSKSNSIKLANISSTYKPKIPGLLLVNDKSYKNHELYQQNYSLYSPMRITNETLSQSYNSYPMLNFTTAANSFPVLKTSSKSPTSYLNINSYTSPQLKKFNEKYSPINISQNLSQHYIPVKSNVKELHKDDFIKTNKSNTATYYSPTSDYQTSKNHFLNNYMLKSEFLKGVGGGKISEELGRHLNFLFHQLHNIKTTNDKLESKLEISNEEIRRLKNLLTEKEMLLHQIQSTGKLSDKIDEMYRLQRERDSVMLTRLKAASDERDAALNALKQSQNNKSGMLGDMDGLEEQSNVIINTIRRQQADRQQQVHQQIQQLNDLIQQTNRQKALVDEELKKTKNSLLKEKEKHMKTLKEKKLLKSSRDEIEKKCNVLSEEVNNLKLYYNLYGCLSIESKLKADFESLIDRANAELEAAAADNVRLIHEKDEAVRLANDSINDFTAIQQQMKMLEEDIQKETLKSQKLERLVNVLRKKLTNVDPHDQIEDEVDD